MGRTLRVKVQVDLTKNRPYYVLLGFINSNPNKERWFKVEYEGLHNYCIYCKHQGKLEDKGTIKKMDGKL